MPPVSYSNYRAAAQTAQEHRLFDKFDWNWKHELVGEKFYTSHTRGEVKAVSACETHYLMVTPKGGWYIKHKDRCSSKSTSTIRQNKYKGLVPDDDRTAKGHKKRAIYDTVTKALDIDRRVQEEVLRENGVNPDTYSHLNDGMFRMVVGNILRGMMNRGEDVFIEGELLRVDRTVHD